jgi:hypothetical protein
MRQKIKRSSWWLNEGSTAGSHPSVCSSADGSSPKNDGILDMDNMPLSEEPECIINELNCIQKN